VDQFVKPAAAKHQVSGERAHARQDEQRRRDAQQDSPEPSHFCRLLKNGVFIEDLRFASRGSQPAVQSLRDALIGEQFLDLVAAGLKGGYLRRIGALPLRGHGVVILAQIVVGKLYLRTEAEVGEAERANPVEQVLDSCASVMPYRASAARYSVSVAYCALT